MTLNDLSYKQLTGTALILSVGVAIPIFSYLAKEQTQSLTSASTKSREQDVALEQATNFDSAKSPVISDVPFWYGKSGDEVLVMGDQFGESEGQIFVGKTQVLPTYWDNNNIQFVLNNNMKSGDLIITRAIDQKSVKWLGVLDIYRNITKEVVDIENNLISFSNFAVNSTIFIITDPTLISNTTANNVSNLQGNLKQYSYNITTPKYIVEFANLNLDNLHNIYVVNNGEIVPFKLGLKTIESQIGNIDELNNPNYLKIVE